MKQLIEKKIKEIYGTKEAFCEAHGHEYTKFSRKMRTAESKKEWLGEFLGPLGMDVKITDRSDP